MSATLTGAPRPLAERIRRFFLDPAGARVAIEFASTGVVGARVEPVHGGLELRALFNEPLSPGAFAPSLDNPGFAGKEEIREATRRVLARIGATPSVRAALVVPDIVARFRLFPQQEIQAEPAKRNALIAFRMQKLLPFPPADIRVISAWPRTATEPVLAIGCSGPVLSAFEQVGQAFGLDVGSVETSSMALLRGVKAEGDALLVRHDPACLTLTVVRNGWPVAIRCFDAAVSLRAEEVRREMASTAVFWRDRLAGQSLVGALVHATDPWFESIAADVSALFGCQADRAQPSSRFAVSGVPAAAQRSAAPALALLEAGS